LKKEAAMPYYVILRKEIETNYVSVEAVFEDKELAEAELESLIEESGEEIGFAYKMNVVGA
jgi:hypothetical protein